VTTPLSLSPDELLTTTRAVRRRLDLDRPVGLEVIRACLQVALQAPSGSNTQGWHWVVVTDVDQRARIAELYRSAFAEYRNSATHPGGLFEVRSGRAAEQERVSRSVAYLAENLHRVPVLLIACVRAPGSAVLSDQDQVSMWGSLLPAVWSYMLAARAAVWEPLGPIFTCITDKRSPPSSISPTTSGRARSFPPPTASARTSNLQLARRSRTSCTSTGGDHPRPATVDP